MSIDLSLIVLWSQFTPEQKKRALEGLRRLVGT